jgi:hypothetical protein
MNVRPRKKSFAKSNFGRSVFAGSVFIGREEKRSVFSFQPRKASEGFEFLGFFSKIRFLRDATAQFSGKTRFRHPEWVDFVFRRLSNFRDFSILFGFPERYNQNRLGIASLVPWGTNFPSVPALPTGKAPVSEIIQLSVDQSRHPSAENHAMWRQIVNALLWAVVLGSMVQDKALAQYRGSDNDGNRGGDDREREEMRRRYEEMRSRYGGGGDSDRSRSWGGFSGGGFSGGGFPGGGFPGFNRGGDRDDDDNDRDRDRDRDDDRGRDNRSGDNRGGNSKPKIQPFVPVPHTPIGVDIPGQYAGGDLDGDKQIDLLEWRQWKPQEVANFMMMDANRDGFLTARELIIAEKNPQQAPAPTAGNAVASYQAAVPSQVPSGPDADGNTAAEKPSAAEARFVFPKLDKNRNGTIDADEWQGSKSIREGFDRQGIKLPLPADQATFLNLYPAQRIVPTLPLPG